MGLPCSQRWKKRRHKFSADYVERHTKPLRAPITQIPRFDFSPFKIPDLHHLFITRNDVQSLVAPFSILTFNLQHQPFDRPLHPDTDCVTTAARTPPPSSSHGDIVDVRTGKIISGRNVKFERDFLSCWERKVFERFGPRNLYCLYVSVSFFF